MTKREICIDTNTISTFNLLLCTSVYSAGRFLDFIVAMSSTSECVSPQIIEGDYVDQHKLINLLKAVYGTTTDGENNFRVEVSSKKSILRGKK